MRRHRQPFLIVFSCIVLSVFACVTVNIYFPAEKVETVAGEIVTDIRGAGDKEQGGSAQPGDSSFLLTPFSVLTCSLAWAEDAITVSNATIRGLKEQMKRRYQQMKPYYGKGLLKEGGNGYVSLAKTEGLNLKERRELQTLVDAENKNRKSLYLEVAKALEIDPNQVNRVAEIFAKEWQKY
ncbi:MAG: DUF1318 domain-containing protein [Deltaproteobacteria bacterium]|nr:DUF1318 domain-containing protein [Deltaproteobacteria bacterium]